MKFTVSVQRHQQDNFTIEAETKDDAIRQALAMPESVKPDSSDSGLYVNAQEIKGPIDADYSSYPE